MESSGIERNREESSKAKVKQIRCFDLNFVLFRKILPVSKRKTVRLTKCVRAVSIERTVADRRTQLLLAFQWQILWATSLLLVLWFLDFKIWAFLLQQALKPATRTRLGARFTCIGGSIIKNLNSRYKKFLHIQKVSNKGWGGLLKGGPHRSRFMFPASQFCLAKKG